MKTLILNANYKPLGIIGSRRAFVICTHRKDIFPLSYHDVSWLDSKGREHKIPSIIRTDRYYDWVNRKARYSKVNVFVRDLYTCQYCGYEIKRSQCTLDHIIPRSKFIRQNHSFSCSSFENVVTACLQCNYKKSDKTLKESRLSLVQKPTIPTIQKLIINKCKLQIYPQEWAVYLN